MTTTTARQPVGWERILTEEPPPRRINEVRPQNQASVLIDPTEKPVKHTKYSATMAGCLIAAIDAVRSATDYAQTQHVTLRFDAANVQALASTMFIQHARSGRL
jgi:hypothetical protein